MTTITFDNFQSPARERTPDAPSYSVKKVLLFSLLLHIALILAIASQTRTPPATKTEPAPIKARLYIAPSPQPDVNDASPSAQDLFSGSHSTLAEETGEQQKAEAEAETGAIDDADTLPTAATESDEIASSRAAISETENHDPRQRFRHSNPHNQPDDCRWGISTPPEKSSASNMLKPLNVMRVRPLRTTSA